MRVGRDLLPVEIITRSGWQMSSGWAAALPWGIPGVLHFDASTCTKAHRLSSEICSIRGRHGGLEGISRMHASGPGRT